MPTTTNETNPVMTIITLAAIAVGGYLGYATAFPNDRKQVRSCISTMLEASRGQVGYGELRQALQELDASETVVVENERRRNFGNSTMVTLQYRIDGGSTQVICAE